MKCLIIAAGKGSRLQAKGDSKPLVPILGLPLIERVIRSAAKAGLNDFYVVTGYNGEKVTRFLDDLAARCGARITPIYNDAWEQENGLSVLMARDFLKEDFILMMGDHLVEPELLNDLMQHRLGPDEIILAVDRRMENPLIDNADVTKVEIEDGSVVNIGKGLGSCDGYDTGVFLCSPAIFEGISECIAQNGGCSLTDGVRHLTRNRKVRAFDIGNRFWIDVDDPDALRKAEDALLRELRDKPNDGPVSRYLNRPLSVRISRHLAGFPITPNQISIISFLISVLSAGIMMIGGYPALLTGGFLAQFASVIDGCDGEIARLKYQESPFGGWFDAVLDRYADAFILFGFTWHEYMDKVGSAGLIIGFMAIVGSFMVSYTADKHDALMRDRFKSVFRVGRDIRIFLVFLGALAHQVMLSLILIAVLMNVETVRRVWRCGINE